MDEETYRRIDAARNRLVVARERVAWAQSLARYTAKSYEQDPGRTCSHYQSACTGVSPGQGVGVLLPAEMRVRHNAEVLAWAQQELQAAEAAWASI